MGEEDPQYHILSQSDHHCLAAKVGCSGPDNQKKALIGALNNEISELRRLEAACPGGSLDGVCSGVGANEGRILGRSRTRTFRLRRPNADLPARTRRSG